MGTIIRALSKDGFVKIAVIDATDIVETARNIHKTLPVATAALGRTLSACALMGNALKAENASVSVRINGGGPLGSIIAVADSEGNVRGYVQDSAVDLPLRPDGKLDVGTAVGRDGTLTVIRDLNMREPYVGSCRLVSGEIAEDFTAYFVESEQVPTACALGVLVDVDQHVLAAGGYIVQTLPGATDEIITQLENNVIKAGAFTGMLTSGSLESVIERIMDGFEPEILERSEADYKCYCSRERVAVALVSVGAEELNDMIAEQKPFEISCQFCDKLYTFTTDDLIALLASAQEEDSDEE